MTLRIAETRDMGDGITVTISAYQRLETSTSYYPGVRVTAWLNYGNTYEDLENYPRILAFEDIEAGIERKPDVPLNAGRDAYRSVPPTADQIEAAVSRVTDTARRLVTAAR